MRQAKRNLKVKRPSKAVSVAGIAGAFLASAVARMVFRSSLTRLSQLDPDLGNFADGLNGNWLIGLVRSRKNSGKAAAVPTK